MVPRKEAEKAARNDCAGRLMARTRGALALIALACATAAAGLWPLARAQVPGAAAQPATLMVQALAPVLAAWIEQSRDAAIEEGVERIPEAMRAALEGYVPDDVLDRVRWREGGSGETSLQQQLFRFDYSPAVTLDYVIVFEDRHAALTDPKLWAHELMHVMQYAEWGVAGFASRYIANHAAVERDAVEYRWQYMKLKGLVPVPAAPATVAVPASAAPARAALAPAAPRRAAPAAPTPPAARDR